MLPKRLSMFWQHVARVAQMLVLFYRVLFFEAQRVFRRTGTREQ